MTDLVFAFSPTDTTGFEESIAKGAVHVSQDHLEIELGEPPIFRLQTMRQGIKSATRVPDLDDPSRGVHGRRGHWLVNTAATGLVRIEFSDRVSAELRPPPVRGSKTPRLIRWVTRPRSLRLSQVTVSVTDPAGLVSTLSTS